MKIGSLIQFEIQTHSADGFLLQRVSAPVLNVITPTRLKDSTKFLVKVDGKEYSIPETNVFGVVPPPGAQLSLFHSPSDDLPVQNAIGSKFLRVFYGIRKTSKMIKKPSIYILFENARNNAPKNEEFVKKGMHLCFTRFQTQGEEDDGKKSNRMFTGYEMFFGDKPYYGNWQAALEVNSAADSKTF